MRGMVESTHIAAEQRSFADPEGTMRCERCGDRFRIEYGRDQCEPCEREVARLAKQEEKT